MTLRAFAERSWPRHRWRVILEPPPVAIADQGRSPACLAFATTAAHEHVLGGALSLSVDALYWAAKQRDGLGAGEEGTSVQAIREALATRGQPASSAWVGPTLAGWPLPPTFVPPNTAGPYHRHGSRSVAAGFDEIARAVSQGGPTIIVHKVTQAFVEAPGGVVSTPKTGDKYHNMLHAVLAVGVGAAPTGMDVILVRNSWGDAWSAAGYAVVERDYFARIAINAFVLSPPTSVGP